MKNKWGKVLLICLVVVFFTATILATNLSAEAYYKEHMRAENRVAFWVSRELAYEETIKPVMEDCREPEEIEEALVEQGYFRKDVPLSRQEQDYLHSACKEFNIPYSLMLGLIEKETEFNNIMGDNGHAYGYCQIWPKWWSGLMSEIGASDLNEPYDNFRTACAILRKHIDRYGSVTDALTAYNTGHGGNSGYAQSVLRNAEKWCE